MPRGVPRVPEPREWLLKKTCTVCGERKPWALFPPRAYNADGSVRWVMAHCRKCDNARPRRYWRTPGAEAAYKREWQRRRRAELRTQRRGQRLPIDPLRAWLQTIRFEEGTLAQLAEDASLHEDTLLKMVSSSRYVSEATAEAVLCARGRRLDDLYQPQEAAA